MKNINLLVLLSFNFRIKHIFLTTHPDMKKLFAAARNNGKDEIFQHVVVKDSILI